jgi:hypothetical protein
MTMRTNRSMNEDLRRGAVDGKLRFLRPNAGGPADETHALQRSGELHTENYGSMGISQFQTDLIQQNVATSPAPFIGGQ